MCCGVIPILFGWFLRVPSLHALVHSSIVHSTVALIKINNLEFDEITFDLCADIVEIISY